MKGSKQEKQNEFYERVNTSFHTVYFSEKLFCVNLGLTNKIKLVQTMQLESTKLSL